MFNFATLFLLQGVLIQQNTKNGVIISGSTLVLQKIKRQVAGNYSCAASSVEGDGKSNYVQLRVMCKYSLLSKLLCRYFESMGGSLQPQKFVDLYFYFCINIIYVGNSYTSLTK